MQLLIIKDHNGPIKFQQAFAEDEDTDNVEELFDNRMKEAVWNFGMGICNAYLGTDLSVYVPVRLDTNWMQYFTFQMVGRVSLPECNTPAVNSICYNVFIYSQFLYFTFRM